LPTLQLAKLDTGGQSVRADALLTKFLLTQSGRILIATLDDLSAVYAARAIEMNRRQSDCIIVSQGLDPNIHGGVSEKKRSTPTIAAARCWGRSHITWTDTATGCCRWRYAFSTVKSCRRVR
jgi:hypothetical protein